MVEPPRIAVGKIQIEVTGEAKCPSSAIDTDSKCILDIDVYSRRGTAPESIAKLFSNGKLNSCYG